MSTETQNQLQNKKRTHFNIAEKTKKKGGQPNHSGKDNKKLRIIPLGGVDEIGKNMMAIEYDNDILVIDSGSSFPTEEMLGIDLVIPDITYLEKNKARIKGIVLTHGHEDHIGALPYVLRQVNVPVYGTKLTLALAELKLVENAVRNYSLRPIQERDTVQMGCFKVEFIKVSHSIMGSVGIAIHTPVGVVVHTGDFKVDYTPVDGEPMDLARFASLGESGVLLFMADSTNVERPGYTMSEKTVGISLDEYFRTAKGRIIISTFSSNIHRIQQIIDSAVRYNRKICFSGRSMVRVSEVARDLGMLNVDNNVMLDINELKRYPDKKLVIITTGSQGEPMSGLVRMATHSHSQLDVHDGDTVILSATPIPGNEKMVNRLINQLCRCGANVIYGSLADVHVSGHACQEELKLLQALLKPKFFVPVHGEYRHLRQHGHLAEQMGMKKKQIIVPQNGHVIEVTKQSLAMSGEIVQAGGVLVDGLGIGDVGSVVLRDRKHLSLDGLVVVVVSVSSQDGTIQAGPDVISRGFVFAKDSDKFFEDARDVVREVIEKNRPARAGEWTPMKNTIREALNRYFYEKTKRSPMILPIIMET